MANAQSVSTTENSQPVYFNNMVEQAHRAVKRVTRPMLGCKAFEAAHDTRAGIALMHMRKKRQLQVEARDEGLTAAAPCDALAASFPPRQGATAPS